MALMARLEAAGVAVELSPDGAGLALQAPAAPPPDLLAEMRRLKPEIIRLLAERAANGTLLSPLFEDSEDGISAHSALAPCPDPEREAIMGEEAAVLTARVQPLSLTTGLLLAASPLAGVPGAWPCPGCGRGIWVSPSWRGPAPIVCRSCELEGAP